MKLYDSRVAPNARRVRMFLAEKGVSVPTVAVDLAKMEQKDEGFTALNPLQRIPVLVLDDGTAISESIAICRYFEETHPQPPLFGRDPMSRTLIEMWQRRVEFGLMTPIQLAFRHTHPAMREMETPQIPQLAEVNRPRALAFLQFLDAELAHRRFVAGDDFSVADITGYISVDFMKFARIALPDDLAHVRRWRDEVAARPSASA
ncbi:MAG: glutathione S-transferase family protein [Rhizobiales bacterium]|nr:glutathione S-transferase family protein [Hyphomicrobiales bacterium]